MNRPLPWMCPRCGGRNPLYRWRCRRCRVKCAFGRRLDIARVLGSALSMVPSYPWRRSTRPRGA